MAQETDAIRQTRAARRDLDAADRRILGALAEDAQQSYATLGAAVNLSAPAVHERVKRLRASGVVEAVQARLNGAAVGKPMLAFVHVDTTGWGKTRAMLALEERPEVEEIHSVTGDTCLIIKVRVASPLALEGLLAQIYDVEGVRGTRTYVTLSTHLERGVQAVSSTDLEQGPYIK